MSKSGLIAAMPHRWKPSPGDRSTPADRLRQAREALGLTQEEAAKRIGIAPSTYSSKERAHVPGGRGLKWEDAVRFSRHLDVDETWIFTGKGKGPKRPADNVAPYEDTIARPLTTPVVGWFGVPTGEGSLYGFNTEAIPRPCFANENTVAIEVKGFSLAEGMFGFYHDVRMPMRKDASGLMVIGLSGKKIVLRRVRPEPGGGSRIEPYVSSETIDRSKIEWASPLIAIMPRD